MLRSVCSNCPGLLDPQDGTDSLSRHVGSQLPTYAAYPPRTTKVPVSSTQRRKPDISRSVLSAIMFFFTAPVQTCAKKKSCLEYLLKQKELNCCIKWKIKYMIHNIQITNKMQFNDYAVFWSQFSYLQVSVATAAIFRVELLQEYNGTMW
jgi:hypothetical protein